MKNIEDILIDCRIVSIKGANRNFRGKICFDSRKVESGDIFVAIRGTDSDGHEFIDAAIEKGADFIVCENFPVDIHENIVYIKTEDSHQALGFIASNYFGNPSSDLKLIGVTGTNGKTTIASLLFRITEGLGYMSGLLSTIHILYNGVELPASHTTPDPVQLQSVLRKMADAGCEYVFMEVSSHAIHQKRIAGLKFAGGVFTNITHDHLDYHKNFKNYINAKKMFFDELPEGSFALINSDDRNSEIMVQNTPANKFTYGLKSMAAYKGSILESHLEGNLMKINGREVWTRLPGNFNAYNILAIYGTGCLLGFNQEELIKQISVQKPVDGRFELVQSNRGITAIVDYAHTPDALKNVLETIKDLRKENQRVICVVGAGGNRDKTKRPLMASIAAELSDKVVLTSDNPRNEDPQEIIRDMLEGMEDTLLKKVITITNRDEALKATCAFAETGDIILVAGKGHETYQEILGVKHHFDDREKIREYLN